MTDEERAGLLKVAEVLEAKSPWVSSPGEPGDNYTRRAVPLKFNLSLKTGQYNCGTVACIGGWLSLHLQGLDISKDLLSLTREQVEESDRYVSSFGAEHHQLSGRPGPRSREALAVLFYPPEEDGEGNMILDMEDVTPQQAAKAIRNFLASDDPKWAEVI